MYEDHKSICRFPGKTASYKKVAKALQRIASQCLINKPVLKRTSTHSSTFGKVIFLLSCSYGRLMVPSS
jgi:hypothetical protein